VDDQTSTRARPVTASQSRRAGTRLLLAVGLVAIAAVAIWLLERGTGARHHTTAVPPQPVSVATVATGTINVVLDGLGTVTPLATVNVQTQIAGQITQIGFTEGQLVHKGDFLIQIDPRPYQVALENAEGSLARDQALLGEARTDLVRYQKLAKLQSIAEQQAQDQAFLVKQYEGDIVIDQAAVDSAKLDLVYCHITSPIDGRVGLRQVDLGNYVQTSSTTPLVVLTQLQPISVEFTLPEDDVPQIQQQMAIHPLEVDAYDRSNTSRIATGTLAALDTQVNNTTGTVAMRAMFDNNENALFPQQFVNARLIVQVLNNVVTVPVVAIQNGAPGTYVYQVGDDDIAHVVKVRTGASDGTLIQVLSGLSPGDRVVTDGTDHLRDGTKVSIPPALPATPPASSQAAGPSAPTE
jgi:multidrug efflux system membrane fusion protein